MDSTRRSAGAPPLASDLDEKIPASDAGDPVADLLTHAGQLRTRLSAHLALLVDRGLTAATELLLRGAIFALILAVLGCMTLIGTWFLIVGIAAGLERLIGNAWSAQMITGALFMLLPVAGLIVVMRVHRLAGLRRAMRKGQPSPVTPLEPR